MARRNEPKRMERSSIVSLLQKYQRGDLTPAEQAELQKWADAHPANQTLMDRAANGTWLSQALSDYDKVLTDDQGTAERLTQYIVDRSTPQSSQPAMLRKWIPYVAAAVLILTTVTWFYTQIGRQVPANREKFTDILPGGNRATLTFANGHTIALSDAQEGIILKEDHTMYNDGTALALPPSDTLVLTTPKGGIYQVTLPDGSKIWLNAASTLKYPARFTSSTRQVELSGEGYFEVEKDTHKPFRVVSEGQQVEVLGTAFNISTYPDEAVTRTTLLEGKVNVIADHPTASPRSIVLSPSEQARIADDRLTKEVVDVTSETAWRNGLFTFRKEKLGDIMRKVARWYDVEVEFQDDVVNRTFSGTVSRYAQISEVLATLSLTDRVQFEVHNKTIRVKSK